MIHQHYVKKFQEDFRNNEITYENGGGGYKTKYDIKIDFTLPEFSETKIINHQFNIDSSEDNNLGYDMIIGQDLMKKLDMIVNLNNINLIWDNIIVPMWISRANHPTPTLNRSKIDKSMQEMDDLKITREATEIIVKILDIKYEKDNL